MPILDRSCANPLPIRCQCIANPVPILRQTNVDPLPICQSNPNPMPIQCQSNTIQELPILIDNPIHSQYDVNSVSLPCQSSANSMSINMMSIWYQSTANPISIKNQSAANLHVTWPSIHCQSVSTPTILCQSVSIHRQSDVNPMPVQCQFIADPAPI